MLKAEGAHIRSILSAMHRHFFTLALLYASSALVCCGGEAAGGGTGGEGAGGGTGGEGPLACRVENTSEKGVPEFECALPVPCPKVTFYYGVEPGASEPEPEPVPHFEDTEAAICVLTRFRNREPSALTLWHYNAGDVFGQFLKSQTIFIIDGEIAASNGEDRLDLGGNVYTTRRQILKAPEYFDGCLAMTDPRAMYECMLDWSAGCGDVDVPCPVD